MNKFYGNSAYTFSVGEPKEDRKMLMKFTQEYLNLGVAKAASAMRICGVGFTVQEHAEKFHFGVVKELVGHSVGTKLHEKPEVHNYGKKVLY